METLVKKIENATQLKEILEPIPPEKWIEQLYEFGGKSCFLGHIHLHFDETDEYGDRNGYGARELTKKFMEEKHGLMGINGASVNNEPLHNGYTEPVIKDRVMHMINDMILAGY